MLLAIKSMGGESAEAWRTVLDDLIGRGLRRPEFLIVDGLAGAGRGDRRRLGRRAGPALHGSQAQEPAGACAERLHDEITADCNDMIYAATPGEIGTRHKAFIRKWRLKHRAVADSLEEAGERLFAFTRPPPGHGAACGLQMRSSDCTKSSNEESRPRPCCHPRTPPPCCSGRCWPRVRSTCARSMVGRHLPQRPSIGHLTPQPDTIASCYRGSRNTEFQPPSGRNHPPDPSPITSAEPHRNHQRQPAPRL